MIITVILLLVAAFCFGACVGDLLATERCAREREADEAIAREIRGFYVRGAVLSQPHIIINNDTWRERPVS